MSDEEPPAAAETAAPSRRLRLHAWVRSRRRLVLAASAVAVIASVAVGGWLWSSRHAGEVVIEIGAPLVYRPLPDLLADLKPTGDRLHHVRLSIVAQVPDSALKIIEQKEPELLAQIQSYLRELEWRELVGQAGTDRLRHDLLAIVNATIAPARAHNLLFKQFLLD